MRRLLLFYLFAFIPFFVRAQVGEYRTDFAVGVNGGYILSNVSFTPDVPQNMQGGMTAGVTFRYTCERYFKSICSIVAEVNIAQVGWKEKIQGHLRLSWHWSARKRLTLLKRLPYLSRPSRNLRAKGKERG